MKFLTFIIFICLAQPVSAKKKVYRKTQSVDFEGSEVEGEARTPYGSYLLQKKGIKFMPLYKVKKKFHQEILKSVDLL